MGFLQVVEAFIVIIIVIIIVGAVALAVLFPGSLSLLASSIPAYFSSASSNSTFRSSTLNFSYPANWVSLSPQLLSSSAAKILPFFSNSTVNKSTRSTGVLFPASSIISLTGFIPSLLSSLNGNTSSIKLPSSFEVVVVGGAKIASNNIDLLSALSTLPNISPPHSVSLSGTPGFGVSITNSTIAGIHVAFGELDIAQVDGSVCFVFGATLNKNTTAAVNTSFNRVGKSLNCAFSSFGTDLSSGLFSKIFPSVAK